jgi:MFS transporter, SP family, solute carrier family 2 (myo-inositol transporter), member 13
MRSDSVPCINCVLTSFNGKIGNSTFGQFFAGMIDGVFIEIMPDTGWRWMLGLAVLPGLVMFYGVWNLPESPRWLALQGRTDLALQVLTTLRESDQEAEDEVKEILQSVAAHISNLSVMDAHDDTIADDDGHDEIGREYGTVSPADHPSVMKKESDGVMTRTIQMIADKPTRRALILGCGLMVVQQCSGINT